MDDDSALWGTSNNYGQILGGLDRVADFPDAQFVIAVGDNAVRHRIYQRFAHLPQSAWATVVHPKTIIASTVTIGAGTVVFGGGTISVDSVVGEHCIISGNCLIGHDCVIGDFVHIAPSSTVCGQVELDTGAFMSAGTTIIPNVRMGEWSQVAAGGVVIKDVPAHTIVKGVPAR